MESVVDKNDDDEELDLLPIEENDEIDEELDSAFAKDLDEELYKLLPNTDFIMNNTFWVGTFPALGETEITRISDVIHKFVNKNV